jgi:Mrp family chromosome partitioning ATPase
MAQLAEQSATLLGGHPRIKELRAQIADLDVQIRREAAVRVRALENEARIAGARVETIGANLDQLKNLAAASNGQDVQMRALEREAKAQRDLLESYLAKFREAAARDSINAAPAEARIISRASVSNVPVFPKRLQMIAIAALLTFTLTAGFIGTRELLSAQNFRPIGAAAPSPQAKAPPLSVPYRRSGSAARNPQARPALPVPLNVIAQLAEALRQAGEEGRRVTVFGAARSVGTSLTAITLARALVRDSRVILIDLALGAPNLAAISTDPNAPGIGELVAGAATISDVITKDQLSQVHLIGAGRLGSDPATVLASPRLAMTIEALARTYDHIVIDAGAVPDIVAEPFAQFAPTGILVVTDPSDRATTDAQVRLQAAGFGQVAVLIASQDG